MSNASRIKEKAAGLPESPGVYLFKDARGQVLYVGKAKSLKKRVQSYFSRQLDTKTQAMVSKIVDLEIRQSPSESHAQILEAALVKDIQPPYNIDLKDDKSFPWIRLSHETFPTVSLYRRKGGPPDDRALYFGPYTNVKLVRQAIKVMRRIVGFRSCRTMPRHCCLYYRVQLCPGPCERKISPAAYRERIDQIRMFLESRYETLRDDLSQKMLEASREERFEEAAKTRDQLHALSAISQGETVLAGDDALRELKRLLQLGHLPVRIEAFDISNISGKEACGSMVSFYKGRPDKRAYRRFRIKTVAGADDYRMLAETVRRRYTRVRDEKLPRADLVLIDGGKGHLAAAAQELKNLGVRIPLMAFAKAEEHIYTFGSNKPLRLKEGSRALNLIRHIRDEAHRFAVAYHHILRRKEVFGK